MARCSLCNGHGCEYNCGYCDYINAGPNSHKVCRRCSGTGQEKEGK